MKICVKKLWALLVILGFVGYSNCSFLEWFMSSDVKNEGTEIESVSAPPHIKTNEDTFLDEAKKYLTLSAVDICQHTIMLKLKSSCSLLSEEAILKISVSLLNCQSEVEGRKKVPCTEEMTLRECTKAMDTTTWNLYHMMSVRAKSVCYLTRQQQFNAYSDMMLSRLTTVAHDQIVTIGLLEEGQEKLQMMAYETRNFLAKAQEHLKTKETKVTSNRKKLDDVITATILAIKAQGIVIAEAQEELVVFLEDIKNAFDASGPANINSTDIEKLHLDILSMLNRFKNNTETLWEKHDTSFATSDVLLQKIRLQKEEVVYKLTAISNALNSAYTTVEDVISNTTFVMSWLFCLVCNSGDHEARIWCYMQHVLIVVGGLVLWILMQLEFRTFAFSFYLDFVLYYWRAKHSLKYSDLTMEIFLYIIGKWFLFKLCKFLKNQKQFFSTAASTVVQKIVSSFYAVKCFIKSIVGAVWNWIVSHVMGADVFKKPILQGRGRYVWKSTPTSTSMMHSSSTAALTTAELSTSHRHTPLSHMPNRSRGLLSDSPKPSCVAMCKTGKSCRNPALIGEEFCHCHLK